MFGGKEGKEENLVGMKWLVYILQSQIIRERPVYALQAARQSFGHARVNGLPFIIIILSIFTS